MGSTKSIVLGIIIAVILIIVAYFAIGQFQPKAAGIVVESNPNSLVYVNEEQVGRTPYQGTRDAGEIVLKLVPESQNGPLQPYETRIKLTAGIQTVVRRNFGSTEELSNGVVISFERTNKKETSLAIVSIPDASQVSLDGIVSGFTPYKTESILPGNHRVTVSAPGYLEGFYDLKTIEGYKLTAVIRLAPDLEYKTPEIIEEEEEPEYEVEILSTPTGFLRVREEPSTLGEEVGRAEPDEKYLFLDEDEDSEWFKIQLDEETVGWVSGAYSEKTEKGEEEEDSTLED